MKTKDILHLKSKFVGVYFGEIDRKYFPSNYEQFLSVRSDGFGEEDLDRLESSLTTGGSYCLFMDSESHYDHPDYIAHILYNELTNRRGKSLNLRNWDFLRDKDECLILYQDWIVLANELYSFGYEYVDHLSDKGFDLFKKIN